MAPFNRALKRLSLIYSRYYHILSFSLSLLCPLTLWTCLSHPTVFPQQWSAYHKLLHHCRLGLMLLPHPYPSIQFTIHLLSSPHSIPFHSFTYSLLVCVCVLCLFSFLHGIPSLLACVWAWWPSWCCFVLLVKKCVSLSVFFSLCEWTAPLLLLCIPPPMIIFFLAAWFDSWPGALFFALPLSLSVRVHHSLSAHTHTHTPSHMVWSLCIHSFHLFRSVNVTHIKNCPPDLQKRNKSAFHTCVPFPLSLLSDI